MKNFVVIMTVMVVVVYTASLSHRDLLNLIREEANHVHKNMSTEELKKWVAVASGQENKCWPEFFCLAEESLNATKLHALSKLKYLIHQYNKNHSVSCQMNKDKSYTLKHLLEDIKNCTKYFKGCQKNCVHMKEKS